MLIMTVCPIALFYNVSITFSTYLTTSTGVELSEFVRLSCSKFLKNHSLKDANFRYTRNFQAISLVDTVKKKQNSIETQYYTRILKKFLITLSNILLSYPFVLSVLLCTQQLRKIIINTHRPVYSVTNRQNQTYEFLSNNEFLQEKIHEIIRNCYYYQQK